MSWSMLTPLLLFFFQICIWIRSQLTTMTTKVTLTTLFPFISAFHFCFVFTKSHRGQVDDHAEKNVSCSSIFRSLYFSILWCLITFFKVREVIHLYRNSSTSAQHLPGNGSVTGLQATNSDTKHCKYLKEWHRQVIYFKLFFVKVWLTPTRSVLP